MSEYARRVWAEGGKVLGGVLILSGAIGLVRGGPLLSLAAAGVVFVVGWLIVNYRVNKAVVSEREALRGERDSLGDDVRRLTEDVRRLTDERDEARHQRDVAQVGLAAGRTTNVELNVRLPEGISGPSPAANADQDSPDPPVEDARQVDNAQDQDKDGEP